ncbi:MAG: hypothetical protein MUF68_03475 [Cyclobacteriaceae bacterium]|nr:hypothetical protein [Cyclobacteriaceae bacterium]
MINLFRNNFSISCLLSVCYVLSVLAIEISIKNEATKMCVYHVVFPDLPDSEEEKDTEEWNNDITSVSYSYPLTIKITTTEISSFISYTLPPVVYLGGWSPPPQA